MWAYHYAHIVFPFVKYRRVTLCCVSFFFTKTHSHFKNYYSIYSYLLFFVEKMSGSHFGIILWNILYLISDATTVKQLDYLLSIFRACNLILYIRALIYKLYKLYKRIYKPPDIYCTFWLHIYRQSAEKLGDMSARTDKIT